LLAADECARRQHQGLQVRKWTANIKRRLDSRCSAQRSRGMPSSNTRESITNWRCRLHECSWEKVSDQLNQCATERDDAVKLAASTSRIALATPRSELQRLRRDVQAQTWPDCAMRAKGILVDSMDPTVNAYLAFMAQQPRVFQWLTSREAI
jgi:hypothetical protein